MSLLYRTWFTRKIKTVPQLARRSAALIRKRGWTQGSFEANSGALCALGAIRLACTGTTWEPMDDPCRTLVLGVVDEIRKETNRYVVAWNDIEGQTELEVLVVLDKIGASE